MNLTAVIITRNEADNIARCLHSLPKGVEIVVVDSYSDDDTVDIATRYGAKVEQRTFVNYAEQKNYACSLASNDWVLSIDADEVLSEQLRSKIEQVLKHPPSDVSAFRIKRRLYFMGKALRFGKSSDQPLRLFIKDQGKFIGRIHERVNMEAGQTCKINHGHLIHHSYANLSDYFHRFNRYTDAISRESKGKQRGLIFKLNLYFRFWFEFLSRYFLRIGFCDGYPGYCYALISSMYAFVKYAKQNELNNV